MYASFLRFFAGCPRCDGVLNLNGCELRVNSKRFVEELIGARSTPSRSSLLLLAAADDRSASICRCCCCFHRRGSYFPALP